MTKLLCKLALVFLLSLFNFLTPSLVKAKTIIFQDNFDDGDISDWTVVRSTCSSQWQASNQMYGIVISSPCITESIPNYLSIPSNTYSVEVDVYMPNSPGMDRNFVFKYLDNRNWYGIHLLGSNVYLHKVVNGTEYFLSNWHTYYTFQSDQTYHFTINVAPSGFDIFINGVFHASVPDSGTSFISNKAGLQASSGGVPNSEVWFDNFEISIINNGSPIPSTTPQATITPSSSPFATVTPTNIPTLTPTSAPAQGLFELPFDYPDRLNNNPTSFKNAFWNRLTAAFDHEFLTNIHTPFTGISYHDCTVPLSCYDSHNGTDFSTVGSSNVLSVASGYVIYASNHTGDSCSPESTFGCVVIAKYPGNNYALYAHLSKIFVNQGDSLQSSTLLGEMGNTGCASCGEHLHFSVLNPENSIKNSVLTLLMSKRDWKSLLSFMNSDLKLAYLPFCTYSAPNGATFSFQDPSGWFGLSKDPWSLPRKKSGCGVHSNYLWKYTVLPSS